MSVQNVRRQIDLNSVNELVSDSSDQTPDTQPSPLPTLRCVPVVKLHCDHCVKFITEQLQTDREAEVALRGILRTEGTGTCR